MTICCFHRKAWLRKHREEHPDVDGYGHAPPPEPESEPEPEPETVVTVCECRTHGVVGCDCASRIFIVLWQAQKYIRKPLKGEPVP